MDSLLSAWPASSEMVGERRLEEVDMGDMTMPWVGFWFSMVALATLDVCYLAPKTVEGVEALPARKAFAHVLFWFVIGLLFNFIMYLCYGSKVSVIWFNGYLLEYLLSLDNVFFFHVVFTSYATPTSQIYKALFFGILGAVVLRLAFYIIGAGFFRLAWVVQIFFGLILIYSGFKTAYSDEDDEDPRENRCVRWITRCLPLTGEYDDGGALFVRVDPKSSSKPATEDDANMIGAGEDRPSSPNDGSSIRLEEDGNLELGLPSVPEDGKRVLRGTMLFLVVVVLQVIDLIFAVDSVTAKIAEHDSTFINFSSSAFAMLCLRSLYFILTRLLQFFRFMKYGVAAILVLIGLKLIVSKWVHIESEYSLAAICSIFLISIVLSAVIPEKEKYEKDVDGPSGVGEEQKGDDVQLGENENSCENGESPFEIGEDEGEIELQEPVPF